VHPIRVDAARAGRPARGWIRGGPNSRVDDKRVLERWLLETGRDTVAPKLLSEVIRQIAPSA
jgi:hypothetical protein